MNQAGKAMTCLEIAHQGCQSLQASALVGSQRFSAEVYLELCEIAFGLLGDYVAMLCLLLQCLHLMPGCLHPQAYQWEVGTI